MSAIDKAALALTQCRKCAGCNRLEQENFRGDDTCMNYRKADAETLIQRRNALTGEQQTISPNYTDKDGHTDNWRPSSTQRRGR